MKYSIDKCASSVDRCYHDNAGVICFDTNGFWIVKRVMQ